jgi:FlgO protein
MIQKRSLIFVAFFSIIFFLNSCTSLELKGDCNWDNPDDFVNINYQNITDQIAKEFCVPDQNDPESNNPADIILVPDFVEIDSLETKSIGLVLGEHLRVSLSQICQIPIRQVEMSKEFKLNINGLTALTRDKKSIALSAVQAKYAIVGVYNVSPRGMTLITKKINLENSSVIKYSSKQISWKCDKTNFYKKYSLQKLSDTFPQDEVSKLLNYSEGLDDPNGPYWYPVDPKACIYRKASIDNLNIKELKLNSLTPSTLQVGYVQDVGSWYGPNNYIIKVTANGEIIISSSKPRNINLVKSGWEQVFNKFCTGKREYY